MELSKEHHAAKAKADVLLTEARRALEVGLVSVALDRVRQAGALLEYVPDTEAVPAKPAEPMPRSTRPLFTVSAGDRLIFAA